MKNKLLRLFLVSLLSIGLCSCFDLGAYGSAGADVKESNFKEYYKSYYENYGYIQMFSQNHKATAYSMEESFFTNSTVNKFTWANDEREVPSHEYIYMGFKVEKDTDIGSISLYYKGDENYTEDTLNIYLYVLDKSSFKAVCAYNDPLFELDDNGLIKKDDNDKPISIVYDFPDKNTAITQKNVSVSKNWNSFTIQSFGSLGRKLSVKEDQFILLSFYNNCAYGKADNLKQIKFTCLNLLIYALDKEGS